MTVVSRPEMVAEPTTPSPLVVARRRDLTFDDVDDLVDHQANRLLVDPRQHDRHHLVGGAGGLHPEKARQSGQGNDLVPVLHELEIAGAFDHLRREALDPVDEFERKCHAPPTADPHDEQPLQTGVGRGHGRVLVDRGIRIEGRVLRRGEQPSPAGRVQPRRGSTPPGRHP